MIPEKLINAFISKYNRKPIYIVRAPGRVNLIGGHTDYNDGFVLPMAINRELWIALQSRTDDLVIIDSLDFDEEITFSLSNLDDNKKGWGRYVKALAWSLTEDGNSLKGWEGVMSGNVPMDAGRSSSAALELAVAKAFSLSSDIEWEPKRMAILAQKAENDWVGVNCGIMDQMISAAGIQGNALLIDCRTLNIETVPMPEGVTVVIMDTMTRRSLVNSAYNERREQTQEAADFFGVNFLRDVTPEMVDSKEKELLPIIYKRAKHIVSENRRVLDAAIFMRAGEVESLGKLLKASHISLRDDYEVSCPELDIIVAIAENHSACFGARMTGAGFGGCAIALVTKGKEEEFSLHITEEYKKATNLEPKIYVSLPSDGASNHVIED
ncbi:MAG: galactokinase [Chloroflexota bacterium]